MPLLRHGSPAWTHSGALLDRHAAVFCSIQRSFPDRSRHQMKLRPYGPRETRRRHLLVEQSRSVTRANVCWLRERLDRQGGQGPCVHHARPRDARLQRSCTACRSCRAVAPGAPCLGLYRDAQRRRPASAGHRATRAGLPALAPGAGHGGALGSFAGRRRDHEGRGCRQVAPRQLRLAPSPSPEPGARSGLVRHLLGLRDLRLPGVDPPAGGAL